MGGQDLDKDLGVYVSWGGEIVRQSGGAVYVGGEKGFIWVEANMRYDVVLRLVEDVIGGSLGGRDMWYTLKYDKNAMIPFRRDVDVLNLRRGNDEVGHLYVGSAAASSGTNSVDVDGREPSGTVRVGQVSGENRGDASGSVPVAQDIGANGADVSGSSREAKVSAVEKDMNRAGEKSLGAIEELTKIMNLGGYILDQNLWEDDEGLDMDASDDALLDEAGGLAWPNTSEDIDARNKRMTEWRMELTGKDQLFANQTAFRESMFKYAVGHRFCYTFLRNCRQRIAVRCVVQRCPFYVCARICKDGESMCVKEFVGRHEHTAEDECSMATWKRRGMRSKVLSSLIDNKIRTSPDYSPAEILKDVKCEYGINASYLQCWRAREHSRQAAVGKPEDQYKLLPWICAGIVKANPGSTAFVELDGNLFRRIFVSYRPQVKAFLNFCRRVLFVDGTHLSGPYSGTLLSAVGLDAGNHLLDVAYAVVGAEDEDNWDWFLKNLREVTEFKETVVMTDRNGSLLKCVPKHFGKEYHSYCLKHLMENFCQYIMRNGERTTAGRDKAKQMLNRIAYAATPEGYNSALEQLREHNSLHAAWVEANEPEQWAESKFKHPRFCRLNNNPIESWNNWMRGPRGLNIMWLVLGHLQKVGNKIEFRNAELSSWKGDVGPLIDNALRKTLADSNCVTNVQLLNSHLRQYVVEVSGSWRVLVDLSKQTCSCKWFELKGMPCVHAMAVIDRLRLPVYDFVSDLYKKPTQTLIYAEGVYPLASEDPPSVDPMSGQVVGGHDVDEGFCREILPPSNPRPSGRPRKRRIESQTQNKKVHRCSNCQQVGHHRNTCDKPRVFMYADVTGQQQLVDEDFVNGNP